MENIEQIIKLWEKDAEIDQTEPGKELLKIPKLHNKYLSILTKHKIASKKAHFDYLRMRKIKIDYYNGRMDQEELDSHGWTPFQFVLKSDINAYLEGDNDLIKINTNSNAAIIANKFLSITLVSRTVTVFQHFKTAVSHSI